MISRSVPQTPSAIASTRSVPSEAGGAGTSRNSTEFGFGGRTVMARKRSPWEVSRPGIRRAWPKKVPVCGLRLPQHQIVPVHHFGAALDAENEQDIARRLAANFFRVLGVIGDEAAADLVAVGPAHDHGIAARECAVDFDDAHRKEAVAAAQRRYCACVDRERPLRLERARDPLLPRG